MARLILLLSILAGVVTAPGVARAEATWHRGMCYAHVVHPTRGYGSDASQESLDRLRQLHVNWISLTPFGFARSDTEPAVHTIADAPAGYALVGETDERVIAAARQAQALGIRVMLKPHIWITPRGGSWRGSIHFDDPADWDRWFVAYERFLLHYARLAQTHRLDALCIGTELATATGARPGRWREMIASVREVYDGPLTYAAHYDGELDRIAFWDALDYIGVNAYFPLTSEPLASAEALAAGWAPVVAKLRTLAQRWQRPVLFTEIGYRATADAAHRPGLWNTEAALSTATQARAYEAAFAAFQDEPWFRGMYWWKWESDDARFGGVGDASFTPQHKPAEFVIRTQYGRRARAEQPAAAAPAPAREAGE